jgi:hypothetical protein
MDIRYSIERGVKEYTCPIVLITSYTGARYTKKRDSAKKK